MSGFEYGNTRLRARSTGWLGHADYVGLLQADDLDRFLGVLSASRYEAEVEAAMSRPPGLGRVDETVRSHLAGELAFVPGLYEEAIRRRLDPMITRWDVRNLVALIRSHAVTAGPTTITPSMVPTGNLDAAALDELAAQPDLRSMIDLLGAWRLPTPRLAGVVRRAAGRPPLDVLALETAVEAEYQAAQIELGPDAVGDVITAEFDAHTIVHALRLRAGRRAGETAAGPESLPESRHVPRETVEALIASDGPDEIADLLESRPLAPGFDAAIADWVEHQNDPLLARRLEAAVTGIAASWFRRDVLGIGVPVGYLWHTEQESENLRLIGRAIHHGLDRSEIERWLVM